MIMFKTILVPTDGSPVSEKAVNAALEFAKAHGGKVIGISVAEPYPFSPISEMGFSNESKLYDEKANEVAKGHVDKIAAAARAMTVPCETVVTQSFTPYEEIIKAAGKFGCDVIFMASHGRTGLSKLFIGSETQKVLLNSSIPVLVFR
jgi:nucleotide-binding universal stress UspA family protein